MSQPARAYKTTGIVLRARNLGEADKIVTLFTADRGKIDAVAKGVRRAKSGLSGRLEFMNETALGLHRGRSLDVITSAEIVRSHFDAVTKPEGFAAGSMIAELVDAFCEPELAVPAIYDLVRGFLVALDRAQDQVPLIPRFMLRLLDALGLAPPCDACVRCGASLAGKAAWLDLESGGLAGVECRLVWMHVLDLDVEDVRNFRALGTAKDSTERAALYARPNVARAVDALLAYHLGRRPKAGAHASEFVTPAE